MKSTGNVRGTEVAFRAGQRQDTALAEPLEQVARPLAFAAFERNPGCCSRGGARRCCHLPLLQLFNLQEFSYWRRLVLDVSLQLH